MEAFRIDAEYDREHSDDGISRYAGYVRRAVFQPFDDPGTAAELAAFAWRQATGPVMAPGYVRRHPRILSSQVIRSDWDGSLIAAVDILTSAPDIPMLGGAGPDGQRWSDWPSESLFASDQEAFYEPGGEDLARSRYMLASVSLRFTVPPGALLTPHLDGADAETCRLTIGVLVRELNAIVGPVLRRIEGS
jgi:hypothetical protein